MLAPPLPCPGQVGAGGLKAGSWGASLGHSVPGGAQAVTGWLLLAL